MSSPDAAISHMADVAWADMDAHVGRLIAERDRLARVLAVERGDASEAPPGWRRHPSGGLWERADGVAILWWQRDGQLSQWGAQENRCWPTALEAMEAIDAGAQ